MVLLAPTEPPDRASLPNPSGEKRQLAGKREERPGSDMLPGLFRCGTARGGRAEGHVHVLTAGLVPAGAPVTRRERAAQAVATSDRLP